MVAIEAHKLQASRNNRNHWQIDPNDLKKWMDGRDTPLPSPTDTPSDTPSDTTELLMKINGLEIELKATSERLAEVKEDRNEWRSQAQKLAQKKRWWHL